MNSTKSRNANSVISGKPRLADYGVCIEWALASRLICFIVQIIAINLIPLHEADAFIPKDFLKNVTTVNRFANHTLVGFARWDALRFVQIAKQGYKDESQFAFFPLYPCLIRAVRMALFPFAAESIDGLLIASGVIVNLVLFLGSSLILYHLTILIFRNNQLALESVKWFCFNPASIFMSACYSESLFQFLTLAGLLSLEHGRPSITSIFFAFSTLTRANGILSIGFIAYWHITTLCILATRIYRSNRLIEQILTLGSHILIILMPFIMFQSYSYFLVCKYPNLPDRKQFCSSTLPVPYTFVQQKYWSLGFLNYYQLKQLPNFLVAFPMIFTCFWIIGRYLQINGKQFLKIIFNFGSRRRGPTLFTNGHTLPFIVHLAFLTLVSVGFMHVQVMNRFILSSTPIIYWAIGSASPAQKYYFKLFFAVYFVLGTLLHSSFYPWT